MNENIANPNYANQQSSGTHSQQNVQNQNAGNNNGWYGQQQTSSAVPKIPKKTSNLLLYLLFCGAIVFLMTGAGMYFYGLGDELGVTDSVEKTLKKDLSSNSINLVEEYSGDKLITEYSNIYELSSDDEAELVLTKVELVEEFQKQNISKKLAEELYNQVIIETLNEINIHDEQISENEVQNLVFLSQMSYEEKIYSDIKFPSYLAKNYDDTVDILIKGKIFNNEEIILNSTDSIILAFNPLFSQKEIMDITYEMIVYGPTGDMVEVLSVPSTSYVSKVSQDNNPMIEQTITFLDFLPSGTYIFEISVTDLQSKKQLIQRIPIMYEKNSKISDFRITDIVLANGDYMVSSINKHSEFDSNYLVFVVENMMLPSGYKYQADFEGELNIYKDEQLIKNVKQFFKQNISQNTYPEQMIFTNNFNFNLTDGNYIFELNLVEKLTNTMITKNYSFDYYTESRFDEYLEQLDLIDKNWFIGGEDNN